MMLIRSLSILLCFLFSVSLFAGDEPTAADYELFGFDPPQAGAPPIPKNAIRTRFLSLGQKIHPDIGGPGSEDKYNELLRAYKRLTTNPSIPEMKFGQFKFGENDFANFQFNTELDSFAIDDLLDKKGDYEAFVQWFVDSHYSWEWQRDAFSQALRASPNFSMLPFKIGSGLWIVAGLTVSETTDFSWPSLVPVMVPPLAVYLGAATYRIVKRRRYQSAKESLDSVRDDLEYYAFSLSNYQTRAWKRAIFLYDVIENMMIKAYPDVEKRPLRVIDALKDHFQRFPLAAFGFMIRQSNETPFIQHLQKGIQLDWHIHPQFWRETIRHSTSEIQQLPDAQQRALRLILRKTGRGNLYRMIRYPYFKAVEARARFCEKYLK
jgi:hypothetical protein